jgi:hypothetical protein
MDELKPFFMTELRRFARTRNMVILGIFLVFCLLFLQYGIFEYKANFSKQKKFLEIEKTKVSQYTTYTQYGTYGIRMLFLTHPVCIFFINAGGLPDLTSFADSGERLNIYSPMQGQNVFDLKVKKSRVTDFSGLFMAIGALMALFYGCEGFRNRGYLKYLNSRYTVKQQYLFMIAARSIIVICCFLTIIAAGIILTLGNGLLIAVDGNFLYFLGAGIAIILFFFSSGVFIGNMKRQAFHYPVMLISWLIVKFIIPEAVNFISSYRSKDITPLYKLEMDKLKLVMDFEKKAIQKAGAFNYGKEMTADKQEVIKEYYNNEFRKLQKMEEAMQEQMKTTIRRYHFLSMFIPTTFYFSVTEELSSQGLLNLMEFYRYTQEKKQEFFRFYMQKLYFSGKSNFDKIENFIKDKENIFVAHSRIPDFYILGLLLTLVYSMLMLLSAGKKYKRNLYILPEKWEQAIKNKVLKFEKGTVNAVQTKDIIYTQQFFNLLSGQNSEFLEKGFEEKIFIDDVDIVVQPVTPRFLYLCRLEELPGDIKAGDMLNIACNTSVMPGYADKRLSQLTDEEKSDLYVNILSHSNQEVFILEELCKHKELEFYEGIKSILETKAKKGAMIIYFTTDDRPGFPKDFGNLMFYPDKTWFNYVSDYKDIQKATQGAEINDVE